MNAIKLYMSPLKEISDLDILVMLDLIDIFSFSNLPFSDLKLNLNGKEF